MKKILRDKKCIVTQCKKDSFTRFKDGKDWYCKTHWSILNLHNGKIPERMQRTPNQYIVNKNYTEIVLYDKNSNEVARTKIDRDDIKKTRKYKWCFSHEKYVVTQSKGINLRIHNLIMNTQKGSVVDHINHDSLDNRKKNLRIVTQHENGINRKTLNRNNKSGHRGIHWNKLNKNWTVQIRAKNKHFYIGSFYSLKEAIKSRKKAEKKYYGKEAKYTTLSK